MLILARSTLFLDPPAVTFGIDPLGFGRRRRGGGTPLLSRWRDCSAHDLCESIGRLVSVAQLSPVSLGVDRDGFFAEAFTHPLLLQRREQV